MKKIISIALMTMLFACASIETYAQTTIDGEFRPRFEYRDGYKKLPDSSTTPNYVVTQRSRLNVKYESSKLKAKISLQDVRTWGDEVLKTDVAGIGLYEAWVELPVVDSLSIKVGRQELAYDNERLLSKGDWNAKGVTHDAVVLKYKRCGWTVDFGNAFNQTSDATLFGTDYSTGGGNYKTLDYIWITKQVKNLKINAAGIADGYQKTGTKNTLYIRGTYGGGVEYKLKDLNIAARGFSQMGKDLDGKDISAYYANADISYLFIKKLTVLGGFEYISGNDARNTSNKKVNTFSTLYGSGHRYNGNMDYFTDMPKHTKGAGLIDGYMNIKYKFSDKVSARADAHYFRLQNHYLVNKVNIDRYLGTETDLSAQFDFSKEVSLTIGYSFMMATSSMEIIVGGDKDKFANWGFATLTVKPKFYKEASK